MAFMLPRGDRFPHSVQEVGIRLLLFLRFLRNNRFPHDAQKIGIRLLLRGLRLAGHSRGAVERALFRFGLFLSHMIAESVPQRLQIYGLKF